MDLNYSKFLVFSGIGRLWNCLFILVCAKSKIIVSVSRTSLNTHKGKWKAGNNDSKFQEMIKWVYRAGGTNWRHVINKKLY